LNNKDKWAKDEIARLWEERKQLAARLREAEDKLKLEWSRAETAEIQLESTKIELAAARRELADLRAHPFRLVQERFGKRQTHE
jgi:hypothetical protein